MSDQAPPTTLEMIPPAGRGRGPTRPAETVDVDGAAHLWGCGLAVVDDPFRDGFGVVVLPEDSRARASDGTVIAVSWHRWETAAQAGRFAASIAELADWRTTALDARRRRNRVDPPAELRRQIDAAAGAVDGLLPRYEPTFPEPERTGASYELDYDERRRAGELD